MMKQINIFLVISLMFIGCYEVPVDIGEFQIPQSDRVVLIEDLTGVKCPNCPKGAAVIESMIKKFDGKVVAIGVHGDFLTKPLPESKYDFRNKKASDLEKFLSPFEGKPAAHINRVFFPNEIFQSVASPDVWEAYVLKELQKNPDVKIELTKNFNATNRSLTLDANIIPLIEEKGEFKISVYITESKIEDAQETIGSIIEEFEHNHVLRDMLTAAEGDFLTNDIKVGQSVKKSYNYTIPNNFKVENMEVVVMVARNKADDKSVLQAAATKLK